MSSITTTDFAEPRVDRARRWWRWRAWATLHGQRIAVSPPNRLGRSGCEIRSRAPQELGWSHQQLALRPTINRTYISSLESGRRNPTLDLIARLAAAMK